MSAQTFAVRQKHYLHSGHFNCTRECTLSGGIITTSCGAFSAKFLCLGCDIRNGNKDVAT